MIHIFKFRHVCSSWGTSKEVMWCGMEEPFMYGFDEFIVFHPEVVGHLISCGNVNGSIPVACQACLCNYKNAFTLEE